MKVLILAGGFATRLWPLTEKRAKPLLLLNGQTILAQLLEKIPKDAETILLTNNKFIQDFERELSHLNSPKVQIFCEDSVSDGEKLGALGALSAVVQAYDIDENIVVFAGDNLLPEMKIEQLICSKDEAKLLVRDIGDLYEARKFGVVNVQNNNAQDPLRVRSFEEKPEHPKSTLVSTGFCALGKDLLPDLHAYAKVAPDALGGIFAYLLEKQKNIMAEVVGGEWFDVGSFETYLQAHKQLQTEMLKNCGKMNNKSVHDLNVYSGKVFLGQGVEVENCRILNSIIYPGCILKNCHISECVIDEDCHLVGLDLNRKLVRKGTTIMSE